MSPTHDTLLAAAARIGRTLCATAYWHEGRCNWVGRSPREATAPGAPITPTVTALGPELYTGSAGVALFLAQLHALAGVERARTTALGAIHQALSRTDDLPPTIRPSFYSGWVGVAYAAVRVGLLLGESRLVEDGLQLARRAVERRDQDHPLDVIGGNGGAIAPLLWLGRLPGGAPLGELAHELAEELVAAATKQDGTWCWDNERASGPGIGPTPLCGLAHGASGMGLALIEIGWHHRRHDWVDGGLAAFRYEDQLYEEDRGNWPDLRELGARHEAVHVPRRAPSMVAWCHGAAGIGLARLRAYRLLADRQAGLRLGVERAIRATTARLQAAPPDSDASPCHGRAGLADTLLYATAVLQDQQHAERAIRTWRSVVRRHANGAEWTCGVASGRGNPSLMLGLAGIGYALLRAHRPCAVPPVLLIESS